MKLKRILKNVFFILILVIPFSLTAQDDPKPNKKQKKAEQKKEQRVQDTKKAEIKGQKRHMKLQEKQTRKRMKKNRKKGSAYVSRRPGFFQRITKVFR